VTVDPDLLERLRRGLPLRLDRSGGFWLADDPVTHPRIVALFRDGLDVSPSGEPQLYVADQWCYLTVDDAYFRVLAVALAPTDEPTLRLHLDDDRRLPLDPATLWEQPERGLCVAVPARRSGRPLRARFTNSALLELCRWIDLDADPPRLTLGGRAWPILPTEPAPRA
jgi:hypothetical protein